MQVNPDSADLEDINSVDEWTTLYRKRAVAKLAGIPLGTPDVQDALLEYLNTDCISLIDQRKQYLHGSSEYTGNKIAATLCGSIPFLRPWAVHELGTDFANITLNAFGLGDIDKLQEYQRSFQEAHNSKDKIAKAMAVTIGRLTVTELLRDTAVDVGVEAVHIQPMIGQAISMGFGYHRMRKGMLKMMDDAAAKAVKVHQGLIIPHVMHSLNSSIPYAHCTSVTDNQSLYICYVCFFTTFKDTSKYCLENSVLSNFVLYLSDVPEEKQFGADSDAGDTAIIRIPGPSYLSQRASEQEGKAFLRSCMIETVNWLTKSHVGCRDAARIGLMGPEYVDATYVSWPGLALPPMREADFHSTSPPSNMEYEIPHYELGYLDCGFGSTGKA
ncbi:hypothetical protein BDV38DRAFT_285114 [Aspergillus pseudotamarii]|uniref:Uncharacterized protein n=1 Tax=Aspergillus pseudotamarii TaxID=132259 RepID=A0A5N6SN17_ASPPS|nr:uncharacterized protein BDV38DRAFT_285114 [Aspergillus pseudotamarii]KAE8135287.1 hypothetical protein BDV38DRAFT_285114 [Aspergillus pseudotamarii]